VDLALHTVSSCGATPGDLGAVLIAGASEDVYPHVSDLLSAAFPVPVLRDPDPPMTVAAGAALAVRPQVRRPAPPPAVPSAGITPAPAGLDLAVPAPGVPDLASMPTGSWPAIAQDGRAPERPPRPPVAVAAVRADGR